MLPPRLRLPLLLIALGLGLALLALGLLILGGYLTQEANDAFSAKLEQAEATRNAALASANPDLARTQLQQAAQLVAEALSLRSDSRRALALREEIEGALRRLDGIMPLPQPDLILDLRQAGGGQGEIEQLVLGDAAYLLDSAGQRVYRLDLDEGPLEAILTAEDSPPDLEDPAHLLWMPPGGVRPQGALLLLTEGRRLWEYRPNQGWHPLALRGGSEWQSLQDAAGFAGKLYILDPAADQVWRYVATDNGYDSNRQGALGAARLGSAQSMAIDGAIYLLDAQGGVARFLSGEASPFPQQGLNRPLGSGGMVFATPLTRWVYLSDPDNERLVVFDKEGRFRRQLVHPLLGRVSRFAVDESRGEVYLARGGQLYRAPLPTESEEP